MLCRLICFVPILAALAIASPALPAPAPGVDASQAAADFARGIELAGERSPAARSAFERAARTYEQLADSGPSARLRYNEGTAWLRAGEPGRAILAFRRAERLGGTGDERLAGNLALARARVQTDAERPSAGGLGRFAMALPSAWLAGAGAALFSAGWLLGAGRLLGRRVPVAAMLAAWGVSGACLGLFVLADHERSDPSLGVVVAGPATARLGPDDAAYEPAFSAPLSSGVELRIIDERAGWALIRLGDGREAWVPGGAVERV